MRRGLILGLLVAGVVAFVVAWWLRPRAAVDASGYAVADASVAPVAQVTPAHAEPPRREPPAPPPAPDQDGLPPAPIELESLRERIPDNRYWELHAPTSDVEVARRRAERAREVNELYGKVLSGTGSEEEIRAYFEERRQEHDDAIELAELVLAELAENLTERDRGLWELTIQLHRQRLADMPRRYEDAVARKREQDLKREAWERAGKP